jgi:hypothetical protein
MSFGLLPIIASF